MATLRVHHVVAQTLANGPGQRSGLWLQGCALACPGCFNPETHAATGGTEMSTDAVFEALTRLPVQGLTVSGGEPLQQVDPLTELLERVRAETTLSVLLFSGHPWAVAARHTRLLACVDVLLAGPYDASLRVAHGLLGSANKTIHFLTPRYSPADLAAVPPAEIIIGPDGNLVMTGIGSLESPMSFEHDLDIALRARLTLVVVVTREETRLLEQVLTLCTTIGRPLFTWDVADGFTSPSGAPFPNARDAITALEALDKLPDNSLLVLKDFHELWGNAQIKRKLRNVVQRLRTSRRTLLVSATTRKLPEELKDEAVVMEFGLPTPDDLRTLIDRFCSGPGIKVNLTALGRDKLVLAAAGLSIMQTQRELSRALVENGVLDDRHIGRMSEAKKQILRDHEALEYYPVSETCDDIGGLGVLKDWLRMRERSFSKEARDYGLPAPKGMALLGIPGTGKSLTARIIGGLWRMPLVRLDVGAVFGSLVGESEERTRRALKVAEAISPCVLWIDELEKALAQGSGDNGTSARVFGTILTWMQEKTAPCFVVATANDIRALPPELMRRGRFDEIFFLDLPTREERREIFAVHIRKRSRLTQDYDVEALARASEGFVGAELEQAVIDAMVVGFNAAREFTTADILDALRRQVPISASHREIVQQLRDWLQQGRAQSASFAEVQEAKRKFVPLTGFDELIKGN